MVRGDEDSKVARLSRELADVSAGRGLREAGRLRECRLLIETAARICHPKGEKGEPLLEAWQVLMDAVRELREDSISIFNNMFALGEDNWPEDLMARRYDLVEPLGVGYKTIYRRGKEILTTVALSIVKREEQVRSAETDGQLKESEATGAELDISVDNIGATLVLDNDDRPIGRESVFAVRPLRPAASVDVFESSDDEFEVSDTVNCTAINLAYDYAETIHSLEQASQIAREIEAVPIPEDDQLRQLKMIIQGMDEVLSEVQTHMQSASQEQAKLSQLGLAYVWAIDLPSLKVGEPLAFSYNTSYRRPISKTTLISTAYLGDSGSCGLGYMSESRARAFFIVSSSSLPRVTLRIRAQRPLRVMPFVQTPETAHLLSMPFIPLGLLNLIARASDGSYKHTFHDLPPGGRAFLIWFEE